MVERILPQIKNDTYICPLHFMEPSEENPDPIIATSIVERSRKKRNPKKRITPPAKKNREMDFLGPAKEPLTYWDSRSATENVMRTRTSIKKFSILSITIKTRI